MLLLRGIGSCTAREPGLTLSHPAVGTGYAMYNERASSVAQERTLLIELFDRSTR